MERRRADADNEVDVRIISLFIRLVSIVKHSKLVSNSRHTVKG